MPKIPQAPRTTAFNGPSQIACSDCALFPICKPTEIGGMSVDVTERLVFKRQHIKAGELIYREGDPFTMLFALTSGSAKEVWYSKNGDEHILGFKLKGDLGGQNGIAHRSYPFSLVALEDTTVCALPYIKLTQSAELMPSITRQLVDLMAVDSYQEAQISRSLTGARNAEEKVQAFIYMLASRLKSRNLDYRDIRLGMSRGDIANYLGITKETLSRSLTQLQKQNFIRISGRKIHINDLGMLIAVN